MEGNSAAVGLRRGRMLLVRRVHVAHYAQGGEAAQRVDHVVHVAPPPPAPPGCSDSNEACGHWAEAGECKRNPSYMVGSPGSPGACILSCGR